MPDISSRQNPKVKLARSLHTRKARDAGRLFLVEGLRHLGELVDSNFEVEFLLADDERISGRFGTELLARFRSQGAPVFRTAAEILDAVSAKSKSSGALAVVRQKTYSLDHLAESASGMCVALLSPQDPGNIGSILRTMDAVQAGPLLLLDGGADPWQPGAVRASMGAIFWHPIVQAGFQEFASWAEQGGLRVCGTSAQGAIDFPCISDYAHPDVLLFGGEKHGLSALQAAVCETVFRIPMRGRGSSLNLSVAAGIILYAIESG